MKKSLTLTVFTDGGSRGNPGKSAYGFVITDERGEEIRRQGKFLGTQTNNYAEYMGIIEALRFIKNENLRPTHIQFFMDSLLAVNQLNNQWKIKNEGIRSLYFTAKELERELEVPITYSHVPRTQNKIADSIVNQTLDEVS